MKRRLQSGAFRLRLALALWRSDAEMRAVNRLQALCVVTLLWAGIFLPGLGSTELRLEEGRRILPAVTMLETGEWCVPYVGGKPFLRKPPLVNWLIAAAIRCLGKNEWAVRVPSVLAMLALAVVLVCLGDETSSSERPALMRVETALVAAIFSLSQFASIDKGRIAEIESVYVATAGIAMACWLKWFVEKRSDWLLWPVPCAILGVGMLAKGPAHLIFFYAVVAGSLWKTREWRRLLHPAHFAGLLIMAAIFAAWLIPYRLNPASSGAMQVWQEQSVGRLKLTSLNWLLNVPRAAIDHLPWILLAGALWRQGLESLGNREASVFRGVRTAVSAAFIAPLLIPGVLPRYVEPLLAPFVVLLAIAVADHRLSPPASILRAWWRLNSTFGIVVALVAMASPTVLAIAQRKSILNVHGATLADFAGLLVWPLLAASGAVICGLFVFVGRWKLARPALLATASGIVFCGGMFVYAASATPLLYRSQPLRSAAGTVNALTHGEKLCVYDPGYMPALFYITAPIEYVVSPDPLPSGAQWILTTSAIAEKLLHDGKEYAPVQEFDQGSYHKIALLRRN